MVIFITGATHTGKTVLAQKILEKYKYPYLSIDHLKMGLIRSKKTTLTPEDDEELTDYLWPILSEIVKTVIENHQNLVIEGGYIPYNWQESFSKEELALIDFHCLVMTPHYIKNYFSNIKQFASQIENRLDDSYISEETLISENTKNLEMCKKYNYNYILIDNSYPVDIPIKIKNV